MVRVALVMSIAFLLAGCGMSDWLGEDGGTPPMAASRPPPTDLGGSRPPPPAANAKCADAARTRADDASIQGFDEAVQNNVYKAVYADCIEWRARL